MVGLEGLLDQCTFHQFHVRFVGLSPSQAIGILA